MKRFYSIVISLLCACSAMAQNADSDAPKRSWAPPNYDSLYKGKPYPAFDLTTLDGKRLTNESCRNKVTFLSFWFEGCAGCRDEFPQVNALYDSLKNDPLCQFVAVTFDDPAGLPDFISKYSLRFPIATISHDDFKKLNFGMASPGIVILDKNSAVGFAGINAITKGESPGRYVLSISKALSMIRALE